VRPALPSRSPLAEADQRLNLDSFAARFNAPPVHEPTAPPAEEEEVITPPSTARQTERKHQAERPPTSNTTPAPRAPRLDARSETPETETAGRTRESSASTPARPDARAARPAERSPSGDAETPAAPSRTSARPARRANALPAPPAEEGRGPVHESARVASVKVSGGERPPAREEAAQPMLDALSRAMAWVEGEPRRRSEQERDEAREASPPPPRPMLGETLPARPSRQAARERAPVTHLEIGRIEVEIVPPPRPAPQAAPARPAPKTNNLGGALRQTFGWRQR
jgi:hypothetical protein